GYNRQHQDQILLKAVRQGDVEVKYLTGDRAFPPGLQPAFTLHEGYLVLASSPEALRRLGIASPVSVAPSEKGRGKGGNDEVLLLRISLKELHRYLNTYREPLIAASAERNRTSHEEARRSIDGLLLGLQFFDHLELSQQATAGRLTLTLRLRPTRPLDR
ncbi:MAG TPA: hypothetical protein VNK04_01540, partial [Gemmataceae bacterium]|nr:hypothetical protein [Gemmataceae bacterium]